jgi:[CysO sulfur-carrier protein]-S-L-cysteine hydrolase
MIKIPQEIVDQILVQARAEAPVEACGYLGGKDGIVSKRYEMYNIDQSTEHFSFAPKDQFKIVKEARVDGLDLIAVYHSHPETPARPSVEDIKLAYDPSISYVIASLHDGGEDVKSFKIKDGNVDKEDLQIIS